MVGMIGTADSIIERMRGYNPAIDVERLGRAFAFGREAHDGQMRASGEPYFTHPIAVANILIDMRLDEDTIITALLHDTVEDCDVKLSTLDQQFGGDVPQLVDGVTKLSRIAIQSSPSSAQAENFRKLLLAMSEDVRVLLVKLADRLHNMRTLHFIASQSKRQRIALETMEIYAPLAERIGMQEMKNELEDLAFAILNEEARDSITARLQFLKDEGRDNVASIVEELRNTLEAKNLTASVTGREKTPYSIWRKTQKKNVSFEQIADIVAFRIIVANKEECYRALGIIHGTYNVVPGRIKDFISKTF